MERNRRVQEFTMNELVSKNQRDQDEEEQRHDCSALQQQAFERGRVKGIEEGKAQCQVQVNEQFNRAIQLANQIGRARVVALEERDRDVVEVAICIAQKILLRQVEVDKELIMRQVRQILGLLVNKTLVTLKVHPDDLQIMKPLQKALEAEFLDGDHLIIEGDEELQPGGCLLEQAGLQLDARIHQQLETVAAEFGLEMPSS